MGPPTIRPREPVPRLPSAPRYVRPKIVRRFPRRQYRPPSLVTFGSLHLVDLAVVVAYLAAVLYIGKRAASNTGSEEGFFLAGRKLGKAYQFFLTFGNATEPEGAVSTASLGRWDRVDTIGFIACCALSAAIVGLFVILLRLAS